MSVGFKSWFKPKIQLKFNSMRMFIFPVTARTGSSRAPQPWVPSGWNLAAFCFLFPFFPWNNSWRSSKSMHFSIYHVKLQQVEEKLKERLWILGKVLQKGRTSGDYRPQETDSNWCLSTCSNVYSSTQHSHKAWLVARPPISMALWTATKSVLTLAQKCEHFCAPLKDTTTEVRGGFESFFFRVL